MGEKTILRKQDFSQVICYSSMDVFPIVLNFFLTTSFNFPTLTVTITVVNQNIGNFSC